MNATGRFFAGLVLASHPFPALMNAVGALAVGLAGAGLGAVPALSVAAAVLASHASIGAMNDARDAEGDRLTAPHKPIVRGFITERAALLWSLAAGALGLGLSLAQGLQSFAVAAAVIAAGMAYNFGLKGTLWSAVPYAVFIPSAAVWPFAAAGRMGGAVLLSYPIGAALAVGLNIANTLPDLEVDAKLGLRGLAHRLGRGRAVLAVLACYAVTALLVSAVAGFAFGGRAALFCAIGGAALVALLAFAYRGNPSRGGLRRAWIAAAIAAVAIAVAWALILRRLGGV